MIPERMPYELNASLFGYWNSKNTFSGRVEKIFGDDLDILSPAKILDAGCSFARTTLDMQSRWNYAEIHGIDRSARCINFSADNPDISGITFKRFNFFKDVYLRDYFDTLFALNNIIYVLHARSLKESTKRVNNLVGSLKIGGFLLISGEDKDEDNNSYCILQKKEAGFGLAKHKIIDWNSPVGKNFATVYDILGVYVR